MSIAYCCTQCGRSYVVDDAVGGKRARCRACGAISRIPTARPAARRDHSGGGYALADEPAAPSHPAVQSLDAPRRRKKKKVRWGRLLTTPLWDGEAGGRWFDHTLLPFMERWVIPGAMLGALLLVIPALSVPALHWPAAIGLCVAGSLPCGLGGFAVSRALQREDLVTRMLVACVPGFVLLYIAGNWDELRGAFGKFLVGLPFALVGALWTLALNGR